METPKKNTTLTNFEIKEITGEKDSRSFTYFLIINRDNTNEAYFCFDNMVKVGWDILTKSPTPINIEIEYTENEHNGQIYKRAVALYTDDDIFGN